MPVSKSGGHLVEKFTPSTHKVDWVKVRDHINQGSGGYHYSKREWKDWRYVLMAELVKICIFVNGCRSPLSISGIGQFRVQCPKRIVVSHK